MGTGWVASWNSGIDGAYLSRCEAGVYALGQKTWILLQGICN